MAELTAECSSGKVHLQSVAGANTLTAPQMQITKEVCLRASYYIVPQYPTI